MIKPKKKPEPVTVVPTSLTIQQLEIAAQEQKEAQ